MIRLSRKASELRPDWGIPHQNMALAYGYLGRFKKSRGEDRRELVLNGVAAARAAVQRDPGYPNAWYTLGMGYMDLAFDAMFGGEDAREPYDQAIACVKKALELNPNDTWTRDAPVTTLINKGWYLQEKDPAEAAASAREALAVCEDSPPGKAKQWLCGRARHILARTAVPEGGDPREHLEAAISAYRFHLKEIRSSATVMEALADCFLIRAAYESLQGLSAAESLRQAEENLNRARNVRGGETTEIQRLASRLIELRETTEPGR